MAWTLFAGQVDTRQSPLGAVLTLVTVVGIFLLVRFLLNRQGKGKADQSMIRQIVLFLIVVIGFVAVILSLPMDPGLRDQISNLFGIVISAVLALSSATFIGNMLAGILIRSIRSFKPGDFIEVGEHFGKVSERSLFHTEIQTLDRNLTTLPNLFLATNPVKVTRASGTYISAEVSLGYDVNRARIEKLLVEAAEKTGLSTPFVTINSLGDFSVVYQVHGMQKDVSRLVSARSKLHGQVLDALHNAQVEIVSPSFMNQRQVGDTVFIPKKAKRAEVELADADLPESIIFDKADQAGTIEKKKETVESISERCRNLQTQIKDAPTEEERARLTETLERWEAMKVKMQENLDKQIKSMDE
ncbi:MAG: mechanosensitive ion channel family protein [Saprospiraceae bacterium]|nr:mechanosensitive ion channel family protein [Saprospiraceae bacterium]